MNLWATDLYDFFRGTPWWVYALLVYLLWVGIRAARPRVVALKKLLILPIIFTLLSLHTLLTSVVLSPLTIGAWAVALLVGGAIGYAQISRQTLQVDRARGLLRVPGSWSVLVLIVIIFASKYYFGYSLSIDPQRAHHWPFALSLLAVSGICTGLLIGRFTCYRQRFKNLPSTPL